MKKAVVATTAARGAAVSSSRITAVQSVYIPAVLKALPSSQQAFLPSPMIQRLLQPAQPGVLMAILLLLLAGPGAARAGIQFENCVNGTDGSISCDTVPTGNTYMNDKDAQYGLLQNASPGWSEFDPYGGYGEEFGDADF